MKCTKLRFTLYHAIDASKVQHTTDVTGIYFIDENGRFFTGSATSLNIIRSGKRNMPSLSIGSVVSLVNPLQQVAGKWKLVLDNTTKVLNTSAVNYNDFWKVEDAKYQPVTVTTRTTALKKIVLNPITNSAFAISRDFKKNRGGKTTEETWRPFVNAPYFEASEDLHKNVASKKNGHELHSWLKFNYADIPAGATIVSATLSLMPHLNDHYETRGPAFNGQRNHAATNPHHQEAGSKQNESYIKIDFNSLLNNIDLQTLSDNSKQTQKIYTSNNLSDNQVNIFATDKQNSVLLNVKSLLLESLHKGRQDCWFKIYGGGGVSNKANKRCFWSANSFTQDVVNGCNKYGPSGNSSTLNQQVSPSENRLAVTVAPALYLPPPCNSCSVATDGYLEGAKLNIPCPTAPQLVIEYISCLDGDRLVQECDSFYCEKTVALDTCISQLTNTAINPYRWGILGNWRMDKTYSYYENRTESEIHAGDSKTDIRTYGTISQFDPYWSFHSGGITASTDTVRWVWNSQSTQFNRKGFETENKDPLGTHNAVQYGYNESIPVAVTQNAKYTEHAFDGFEDYAYHNDACDTRCNIQKHLPTQRLQNLVTDEEAHSGKYSLALPVGSDIKIATVLDDGKSEDMAPDLWFKSDTADRSTINRVENGKGLKSTVYLLYNYQADNYGLDKYNYDAGSLAPITKSATDIDYNINNNTQTKLGLGRNPSFYKVVWEGYLTLKKSRNQANTDPEGEYLFSVSADNTFKLWIDDKPVLNAFPNDPVYFNNAQNSALFSLPVKLYHGKAYKIRVEHTNNTGDAYATLNWKKPSARLATKIPIENYHNSLAAAQASIVKNTIRCISWEGARASANILYNEFSPIAGNKYVVSAWVKEQKDCKCDHYENTTIEIYYSDAGGNYFSQRDILKPSGNIIESWQRIEEVITIPKDAKHIEVHFKAVNKDGNSGKIFFDDWRFHPYNANMKSFVYDAVSLRLMGELDENNYTSFYEYDDDGSLIRIKKETERGIKTIRETRTTLRKE